MTPILVADLTLQTDDKLPAGSFAQPDPEYINPSRIIWIRPGGKRGFAGPDGRLPLFGIEYEAPGNHVDAFHNDACFGPDGLYQGDPKPLTLPLWTEKGRRVLMIVGTADDFAAAVADGEMEYDFAAREAARQEAADRAARTAEHAARRADDAAGIDVLETVQADREADEVYYRDHPEEAPIEVEDRDQDDLDD